MPKIMAGWWLMAASKKTVRILPPKQDLGLDSWEKSIIFGDIYNLWIETRDINPRKMMEHVYNVPCHVHSSALCLQRSGSLFFIAVPGALDLPSWIAEVDGSPTATCHIGAEKSISVIAIHEIYPSICRLTHIYIYTQILCLCNAYI